MIHCIIVTLFNICSHSLESVWTAFWPLRHALNSFWWTRSSSLNFHRWVRWPALGGFTPVPNTLSTICLEYFIDLCLTLVFGWHWLYILTVWGPIDPGPVCVQMSTNCGLVNLMKVMKLSRRFTVKSCFSIVVMLEEKVRGTKYVLSHHVDVVIFHCTSDLVLVPEINSLKSLGVILRGLYQIWQSIQQSVRHQRIDREPNLTAPWATSLAWLNNQRLRESGF